MKKLFMMLLFAIFYQQIQAQNIVNLDKEKLLDYYQSQRYLDAANYLQSIYPENTEDIKVLNQIAYCFMMAKKLPEAEKNYLKLLNQQPNSIPLLFNLAAINLKRGNTKNAKTYFECIIKLDSTNFNGFKQLADLYTNDTDSQKVSYLIKANALSPTDADVALDLAKSYGKLKKYESAYQLLKVAIDADTGNFILQQAKLPIALQLKKYKEVIETGEKLLTGGIDAKIIRDVAMAYYNLKNYQKAIEYFKMLEVINAQNESSFYYTSLSYRNLNDYKSAAEYAKKTIDEGISPNTSSYYLLLGGIYEVNQQLISSAAAYKKGLTFSENSATYYRLGILYDYKLAQKKNAITYYTLYLKSNPDPITDKEQIAYSKNRLAELKGIKNK